MDSNISQALRSHRPEITLHWPSGSGPAWLCVYVWGAVVQTFTQVSVPPKSSLKAKRGLQWQQGTCPGPQLQQEPGTWKLATDPAGPVVPTTSLSSSF